MPEQTADRNWHTVPSLALDRVGLATVPLTKKARKLRTCAENAIFTLIQELDHLWAGKALATQQF
jgi:hypothetical protein